ncbi:MAG: OmpA family protein [Paracoccaceae bacterium]
MITALELERTGPTVRALKTQNALQVQPNQQLPTAYDFPSINLNVAFDGETHLLTAQGMRTLRTLAVALQDPKMSGQTFQVAGHVFVEGSGGAQFPLSARRAQAVVDHLVVFYGLPRDKLTPVGYGATKPVNVSNPYGIENTRIEFINLSGF